MVLVHSPVVFANSKLQCKYPSTSALLAFLNRAAAKVALDKSSIDSSFLDLVTKRIEGCEELPSQVDLQSCTSNFKKFAAMYRLRQHPQHRYGFKVTDAAYLNDPLTQTMIELPSEFKNGLPENWEEIAKKNNWPYAEFESSVVGNKPYYSFQRLTMLVERPIGDLWIQFTRPDVASRLTGASERLINVIGVSSPSENAGRRKPYFAEYLTDWKGRNPRVHTNVSSCYECHANGMRSIVPALGSASSASSERIAFFNQRMEKYGSLDWAGLIDTQALGPAIGRKQSCVACHNDENIHRGARASLRYYTDFSHIKMKMVNLLQMPPGLVRERTAPQLKRSLNLLPQLSEGQREGILSPLEFRWSRLDRSAAELSHFVTYLYRLGQRSHHDTTEALREQQVLQHNQQEKYDSIMTDFAADLKAWLVPEDKCK